MDDTHEEKDIELEAEDNGSSDEVEYAEDNLKDTVKTLKEKIKVLEKEKLDVMTSWQKDKAEFVNARRRDEEAKLEFMKYAKQGVIEEMLPALDSFDMATANKEKWESVGADWRKGVENIHSQLLNALSKNDVTAFGAKGDAFDPNLHHSIATVPTDDKADDHKVAEVLQRGYTMAGKVIRPALVKVFEA